MKNLLNLLCAFLMFCASLPIYALADNEPAIPPGYLPIGIEEETTIKPNRGLGFPFEWYYQSGTIVAEFYENVGIVSITVVNTDTGESWNANLDSSFGFATFDITTNDWQGYYELIIVDGLNRCYVGCFEL